MNGATTRACQAESIESRRRSSQLASHGEGMVSERDTGARVFGHAPPCRLLFSPLGRCVFRIGGSRLSR